MLLQETKDYVNDELMPERSDGYENITSMAVEAIAVQVIKNIVSLCSDEDIGTLFKPTKVANNIVHNQDEFIDYVVEAFKEMEEK